MVLIILFYFLLNCIFLYTKTLRCIYVECNVDSNNVIFCVFHLIVCLSIRKFEICPFGVNLNNVFYKLS